MDDSRDESGSDDAVGRQTEEDGQIRSDALELVASTTLVEVTSGVAVVFGEVPDGLELISLDMVPSFDRAQLSTALGSFGNAGTIAGNVAEAVSSAQGLFRVNEATLSLLKSGGQMAAKDGAKLGAIFKNGELVAQARFHPRLNDGRHGDRSHRPGHRHDRAPNAARRDFRPRPLQHPAHDADAQGHPKRAMGRA